MFYNECKYGFIKDVNKSFDFAPTLPKLVGLGKLYLFIWFSVLYLPLPTVSEILENMKILINTFEKDIDC